MNNNKEQIIEWARQVLDNEAQAIQNAKKQLNNSFNDAIEKILDCRGKVIITAIGKSGHIGRKMAATMASTGTPAFFVHPSEAYHGDLGMISSQDIVIAISYSGNSSEILNIMPVIKKLGVSVIGITGNEHSPLGKVCDVVINVTVAKEADFLNLAPTASTTATLALGDALAVVLLKLKGFTSSDFAFYHPGGSLGRSFLSVGELMTETPPRVSREDTFQAAMMESSRKNLGAVCIVDEKDKLVGIITDGDIRRIFQKYVHRKIKEIFSLPVKEVMTPGPHSVTPDVLAKKVFQIMEQKSTYVLPVVDYSNVLYGLIRMHDLVQAGFTSLEDNTDE